MILLGVTVYHARNKMVYPASLEEVLSMGDLLNNKPIFKEAALYQVPTRAPDAEADRIDIEYRDLSQMQEVPENLVVIWDKSGNWPDGGMIGFISGKVRFVNATSDVWCRLSEALKTNKNKALVLEYIPDADVSGIAE